MNALPTNFSLAVFDDFAEEHWPSMDLVAEMLLANIPGAQSLRPRFRSLFGQKVGKVDRAMNRFLYYPRHARNVRGNFDCFHICDHSYAHLALELPGERTGVFCHDLDAFRCLIDSARDHRPKWFRALARRTLRGLQRAAVVFHATASVREEIIKHQLLDPTKLVHAPLGVASEFSPAEIPREDFVLHVGSAIPRKRLDVLHRAVELSKHRLIQTSDLPPMPRLELADLYRRAKVLLVTSEAEGFGLPVIEALACGTPVIASDIASLREAGGDAAVYCAVGDAPAFARAIEVNEFPSREKRLAQAAKFSWQNHARIILNSYRALVTG